MSPDANQPETSIRATKRIWNAAAGILCSPDNRLRVSTNGKTARAERTMTAGRKTSAYLLEVTRLTLKRTRE